MAPRTAQKTVGRPKTTTVAAAKKTKATVAAKKKTTVVAKPPVVSNANIENWKKKNEELNKMIKEAENQKKKIAMETEKTREKMKDEYRKKLQEIEKKRVKVQSDTIKLNTETHKLEAELNKVKNMITPLEKKQIPLAEEIRILNDLQDDEKAEGMMNCEKKRVEVYEKRIHVAQEALRDVQAEKEVTAKIWTLCEICDEEFSEGEEKSPRLLECGHTLCFACIKSIAKPNGVICPFDGKCTLIKKKDLDQLRKNYAVFHM